MHEHHRAMGEPRRTDLIAAALIGGMALLALGLVMHHPVLHRQPSLVLTAKGLQELAVLDRLVHGGLIAAFFLQSVGFHVFAARLGSGRPVVVAGYLSFVGGVIVMTIPAILDGFVAPDLAHACLTPGRSCGGTDSMAFQLVAAMIQDFTKLALVAIAVSTLCWSIALLVWAGAAARAACVAGLLCAATPIWILLSGDLLLQPSNLAQIIAAQVVWSLIVAGLMMTRPVYEARPA